MCDVDRCVILCDVWFLCVILPVTSKDMPICPLLNERFNSGSSRIKLVVIVICYQLAHANIKFKPAWWLMALILIDAISSYPLKSYMLNTHISNPTSTPCLTTTILRLLNRNIPAIALLIRNCLCCSTAYQCKIRARYEDVDFLLLLGLLHMSTIYSSAW